MIEMIKSPPRGYEEVVLRSFYLKKDMILKEVKGWINIADKPASYGGLVNSHNYELATQLTNNPASYKTMLQ